MGITLDRETKIDLHMHTTVSDGTDTPREILEKVREKGIGIFSITDHDDIEGGEELRSSPWEGAPLFLTGAEFSSRDEGGKYHILGYGYELEAPSLQELTQKAHAFRIEKMRARVEGLSQEYHFQFPREELEELFAQKNPGKPHLGLLCVKYGYAASKEEAIEKYINSIHTPRKVIGPEEIIGAILQGGGIPVLAHPVYGSGSQYVTGEDLEKRVLHLKEMGLLGLECFYSRFSPELIEETLQLSKRHHLYVTAGSDYHGGNKRVGLGENHFDPSQGIPEEMGLFFERVRIEMGGRG